MGFIKDSKSNAIAQHARRAVEEGRTIFLAQFRGSIGHSPSLTRPIADVAEMIEAVESLGWRVSEFTSVPYKDNMTVVCLFRRAV
jgi:hypothetical protein